MKILSWNIARGSKHMAEIQDLIITEKADIAFLHETDNDEENLKSIKINGYETVVGKPGEHDEKVRMMAFIKKFSF